MQLTNTVIKKYNEKVGRVWKTGYLITCWNKNCQSEIYVKKKTWEDNLLEKYPRIFSCGNDCKIKLYKTDIYINRNLERFGYKNGAEKPEVVHKIKKHFIDKYGVENPFQIPEVIEKSKETCLHKYGVENYNQSQIASENKSNRVKCSQIEMYGCVSKELYKKTMLERYGTESIFSIIKFTENYYIKKYGYDEGIKKWKIRCEKTKQTLDNFINRYGEEIGRQRYETYLFNTLLNYHGVSKKQLEFSRKIYDMLDDNIKSLFKGPPITVPYMIFLKKDEIDRLGQKVIIPDIVINKNIIIEFDGDYWHSKCIESDKIKDDIFKKRNYRILRIKESDYDNDKTLIVENVINNINNFNKGI